MIICGGTECGLRDCLIHLDLIYCEDGEEKFMRLDSNRALTAMYYSDLPIDWFGVEGTLTPKEKDALAETLEPKLKKARRRDYYMVKEDEERWL